MRYAAVLFDLDGTLVDSIGLILDSFHHALDAFGVPRVPDDVLLATVGTPLRGALARWAADETTADRMLEAYRAYYVREHDARVRAYAGVVEAVHALLDAGTRLAVVTSKNRAGTLRSLRAVGLDEALSIRVTLDDVTNAKPHREPVDRALALIGADPASTLFVGDSLHDMHAGRDAEVATGAALWGPFSRAHLEPSTPTHWLESPRAVVDLAQGSRASPGR